jgi:hypothetical protein
MSYPGPAAKWSPLVPVKSLLPEVTSLKYVEYAEPAARYRAGFANPTDVPPQAGDASASATSAAQTGDAALVPPIPIQLPS